MIRRAVVRHVLIELEHADAHAIEEWRAAQDVEDGAEAALDAQARGDLVLGALYVECAYGPEEDDAVGLTLAGVELRPGIEPLDQLDDDWIDDALAEAAAQLEDERGIEVTSQELRELLTLSVSDDLLAQLSPDG
jgi:hypothetical protein